MSRCGNAAPIRSLYPFFLVEPVVRKLAFVHDLVQETGRTTPRPILD